MMIFEVLWAGVQTTWHFLLGWAGVDMIVGFAAVAVAILEPPWLHRLIPNLRAVAISAAVVAFTLAGAIAHGYKLGIEVTKAEWNAALAREAKRGERAHDDAVRRLGPVPTDRKLFDADPFNRNRGKR